MQNKRKVLPYFTKRQRFSVFITFFLLIGVHLFFAMPDSAAAASSAMQDEVATVDTSSAPLGFLAGGGDAARDAAARQLFELLNNDRAQAGLPPLAWDDGLAQAAMKHAQLMASRGELSHQFPGEAPLEKRVAAVPLDLSGENVALNSTVAGANSGLMHSPPHRANILNTRFNVAGIAIVETGDELWVVQDFAHRIETMSRESAADTVASAFDRGRSAARLPRLQLTSNSRVSSLACAMARTDHVNTAAAMDLPDVLLATAYTSSALEQLPESAIRSSQVPNARRYSVGVCFERSASYPSGVYWVLLVLFTK